MNKLIEDGRPDVPAGCFDRAADMICQQGYVGSSPIPNPDAVVSVPVSDPTDSVCTQHANGVGRSAADDWRIALHESGHVVVHRLFGTEVSATIVPDGACAGRTWSPQGVDAAVMWSAESAIAEPGVSRDGDVRGVFSVVQQGVIAMMGGCAAEMVFFDGTPPKYIASDVPNADWIAGFVCRTTASLRAFVEHCYQESLALVEQHKTVVRAVAQALIEKRTLDGAEIDAVIAPVLAAKAAADERQRRSDWNAVLENAAGFVAGLET